ncbi:MAG: nitrogenase iron-molybdenum cofactor biosynthesis protein NifE, partial [Spirochaetaceae bacterium]
NLARMMEEKFGIPWIRVSYFGVEDMSDALYQVADHFADRPEIAAAASELIRRELQGIKPVLEKYRQKLQGKKAAIYVGGGFKAFSLIKALANLGMETAVVGSQTGSADDYARLAQICGPGTIVLDDSNPVELANCVLEKDVDLFIGGVKERPLAYKLGVGFCDHNHERKKPLAGFLGMKLFAEEVFASVMSPVWQFSPRREV